MRSFCLYIGQQSFGHHPTGHHPLVSIDAFDSIDAQPKVSKNQTGCYCRRGDIDPSKKFKISSWNNEKVLEWLGENEMTG